MGYSLTLGEATLLWNEEECRVGALPVSLPKAPAFGEPTDNSNSRWPSYASWSDFSEQLGISDLFAKNGEIRHHGKWMFSLMPCHPGVAPVTSTHVEYVQEKLSEYRSKYPDITAGFDGDPRSGVLARGEWLLFWLEWAVKNCDKPVFVNT